MRCKGTAIERMWQYLKITIFVFADNIKVNPVSLIPKYYKYSLISNFLLFLCHYYYSFM